MKINRAVFIDRDGTLINERGYLSDHKKIFFYRRALQSLKKLNEAGYLLFIVTNQSGIARGYVTRSQLEKIHTVLRAKLKKVGVRMAEIYFCPHGPADGCRCRKPKPYFAQQAAKKFKLDLKQSFMIGDQIRDIQFGINAKLTPILVLTGYGRVARQKKEVNLPHVAGNLSSAVNMILAR